MNTNEGEHETEGIETQQWIPASIHNNNHISFFIIIFEYFGRRGEEKKELKKHFLFFWKNHQIMIYAGFLQMKILGALTGKCIEFRLPTVKTLMNVLSPVF